MLEKKWLSTCGRLNPDPYSQFIQKSNYKGSITKFKTAGIYHRRDHKAIGLCKDFLLKTPVEQEKNITSQ